MPFFDDKLQENSIYIIAPISISLIILCFLGIRDLFISNVIISDAFISAKNVLSSRKLRIEEIMGYKINENYIFIYPKNKLKKRIKISNYIADNGEIGYWLHTGFINLNTQEQIKEVKDFQRNSEYGISTQDKYFLLQKAHKTAKWMKIISIFMTILALFLAKYLKNENFAYILVFFP